MVTRRIATPLYVGSACRFESDQAHQSLHIPTGRGACLRGMLLQVRILLEAPILKRHRKYFCINTNMDQLIKTATAFLLEDDKKVNNTSINESLTAADFKYIESLIITIKDSMRKFDEAVKKTHAVKWAKAIKAEKNPPPSKNELMVANAILKQDF